MAVVIPGIDYETYSDFFHPKVQEFSFLCGGGGEQRWPSRKIFVDELISAFYPHLDMTRSLGPNVSLDLTTSILPIIRAPYGTYIFYWYFKDVLPRILEFQILINTQANEWSTSGLDVCVFDDTNKGLWSEVLFDADIKAYNQADAPNGLRCRYTTKENSNWVNYSPTPGYHDFVCRIGDLLDVLSFEDRKLISDFGLFLRWECRSHGSDGKPYGNYSRLSKFKIKYTNEEN